MERLGDELRHALRGVGVPDAGALAEITRAWPIAVGDAIARSAWPLRLSRDGTLHVAAISSAWSFELTSLAGEILDKLRAAIPDTPLSALRFAPGPLPEPAAEPSSKRWPARPAPGPADRRRAAELTAALSDEQLRATVARAAAASLARAAAEGVSDRRF